MIEILRASLVIARRDLSAILFSKAFILFLLGPLFPVAIGVAAGGLGERMASESMRPTIGVALTDAEADALDGARSHLARQLGDGSLPELKRRPPGSDAERLLARKDEGIVALLSGSLAAPVLTGRAEDMQRVKGQLGLMIGMARAGSTLPDVAIERRAIAESSGARQQAQLLTGRAAQVLIFLLTMLLAGMVLSNMVEEKTNKVIEVLAAAVPVDAIFLGKLMAMLAMSLIGIAIWGAGGLAGYALFVGSTASLPPPAVGWPLFILLGILYFTTAYTLLGSLFIGIGAQASTVREVQTISMPITMSQVVIFFFATYAVNRMGEPPEIAAAIFPFSSPFAMIARAAQSDILWTHALAIGWHMLWIAIIIRLGVALFRRNVLKSGRGERRGLFRRRSA